MALNDELPEVEEKLESVDSEHEEKVTTNKGGKRFFDKWAEKFKEFLDNAE